jgi:hypothetical protein
VKSRCYRYEDRRSLRKGERKRVYFQTEAANVGRVGAPPRDLTTSAADCQFVHENRKGSPHTKKYQNEGRFR